MLKRATVQRRWPAASVVVDGGCLPGSGMIRRTWQQHRNHPLFDSSSSPRAVVTPLLQPSTRFASSSSSSSSSSFATTTTATTHNSTNNNNDWLLQSSRQQWHQARTLTAAAAADPVIAVDDDHCSETATKIILSNYSSSSSSLSSSSSTSVPFRYTQQGTATLVARCERGGGGGETRVQISHKAPCRWIPITRTNTTTTTSSSSSKNDAATAASTTRCRRRRRPAVVALSHYGGGMADGDTAVVDITVHDDAFVQCTSQGTNRVYKKKKKKKRTNNNNTSGDGCAMSSTMTTTTTTTTRMDTIVRFHGTGGTCWMTPDPTQLQRDASYQQNTCYELDESSRLVAIDWFTAGRLLLLLSSSGDGQNNNGDNNNNNKEQGERWDFDACRLRTTVSIRGRGMVYVDAQDFVGTGTLSSLLSSLLADGMDYGSTSGEGIVQFQTFGTIVLYNVDNDDDQDQDNSDNIVARFGRVQRDLCRPHLAVRRSTMSSLEDNDHENNDVASSSSSFSVTTLLSGRVILSVSPSQTTPGLHVVKFAAESNEDMFRIFHYCLGDHNNVYGDRIRAVRSAPPIRVTRNATRPSAVVKQQQQEEETSGPTLSPPASSSAPVPSSSLASLSLPPSSGMFMMADSMFPIGSFAHSFGLEAAAQLGLFSSPSGGGTRQNVAVHRYLRAVLRSTVQQSIPLLRTALRADVDDDPALWRAVNDHADRLLSANPPAYRASIEQAKNLRRILDALDDGGGGDGKNAHRHWFNDDDTATHNRTRQSNFVVHLAPLWGRAATTTFGMTEEEACRAFVYTVARDLVSSAVRMNLLGPMEGQTVLWKDLLSASSATRRGRQPWYDLTVPPNLDDATTAAPAVDAIQPCHDLLASRLFRS